MYKHIDIPLNKFVKSLPDVPDFDPVYKHFRLGLSDLEPEFVDWLQLKGLELQKWISPLVFYAHPGTRTSVHSDFGSMWSMNILLTDGDVEMQWRKRDRLGERKSPDLDYIKYSDDLPILGSTKLGRTICRINIPHVSFNHGPGTWILSLRTTPGGWFEVINRF